MVDRRLIGTIVGVIAIICTVCALAIDEMTGYYTDSDDDSSNAECGWQEIHGTYGYGEYSDCCSLSDKCCDAETAGKLWLAFGILAIVAGVVGLGVEFGKRTKFTELSYFAACIFAAVAVIGFFAKNELCWDSDEISHDRERFGTSAWLMVVSCVVYLIAAVASHDTHGYIRM